MTSEESMPTFVVVLDKEKPVFINLNHIVTISDLSGGAVTLGMSSGNSITVHGGEAIKSLLNILSSHTVTLSGQSLGEIFDKTPGE